MADSTESASARPSLFLDANVLFSSALGGESFTALWGRVAAAGLRVSTSPQCVDEARRNVAKKRPDLLARLDDVLSRVELTAAPSGSAAGGAALPEDDAQVYAAAVESGAAVLLTGNTRHFGALMARADLPVKVRTVRAWLDEAA